MTEIEEIQKRLDAPAIGQDAWWSDVACLMKRVRELGVAIKAKDDVLALCLMCHTHPDDKDTIRKALAAGREPTIG